ncbi:MAG: hypothetical protein HY556_11985 [Euryarchaeota archaeon]|nr:hypothetical protein [Euryarchaeota archaeon]
MSERDAPNPSKHDRLRQLGLTEYQAKTYVALLSLGSATASEIAGSSAVPQPKIYGVLKELETRGLVESSLGPPASYRAVAIEAYLRGFARDLRGRADSIDAEAQVLAAQFRPSEDTGAGDAGRVAAVSGKRNILSRAFETAREAQRTLQISGTAPFAEELSKGFVTVIREKTEDGVEVRVLLPITRDNVEQAKRLGRYADVRHNTRPTATFAVVADESAALLSHARSTGERPLRGQERAIMVTDRALVRFASEAIASSWHVGTPLPERIAELDGKELRLTDVVRDPREALAAAKAIVAEAERDLSIAATELGVFQLLGLKTALLAARGRGVRIRVLVPQTSMNVKALDPLNEIVEVRTLERVPARFFVADARRALLIDSANAADSPFLDASAFGPHTVHAKGTPLGGAMAALFDALWIGASPRGRG